MERLNLTPILVVAMNLLFLVWISSRLVQRHHSQAMCALIDRLIVQVGYLEMLVSKICTWAEVRSQAIERLHRPASSEMDELARQLESGTITAEGSLRYLQLLQETRLDAEGEEQH